MRYEDLSNRRFGKLVTIEPTELRENGYIVWLCKCDCGNKLFINSKRLKRGSVTNCGCDNDARRYGNKAEDISGKKFGLLTAIRRVDNKYNRTCWECQCECGNTVEVCTRDLKSGKKTDCGCQLKHKRITRADLIGKEFGQLRVIEKTELRDYKGCVIWLCRCSCGNQKLYSTDVLKSGDVVSCGCRKKQHQQNIYTFCHFIDGTCVQRLLQKEARADSSSGYKGITILKNGKYRASIGFKRKMHYLGTYDKLEDALKARKKGERLHEEFLDEHRKIIGADRLDK